MTPTNLLKSLAAEVSDATKNLRLPIEYMDEETDEHLVKVNVFTQYIPQDLFEQTTYFPCVVIELVGVRDNLREGSTAEVALSCGVYAKEEDGWQDAFHLMELIRQRLLTKRTIAQKFRLMNELITSFPDEQPTPFFFIYLNAEYQLFLPQEELEF